MGQCNFLHLWHQKLYRAFRFGTLWPISCSYPRHSQLTTHSLMLANGRIRQSLTALVVNALFLYSNVMEYNTIQQTSPRCIFVRGFFWRFLLYHHARAGFRSLFKWRVYCTCRSHTQYLPRPLIYINWMSSHWCKFAPRCPVFVRAQCSDYLYELAARRYGKLTIYIVNQSAWHEA